MKLICRQCVAFSMGFLSFFIIEGLINSSVVLNPILVSHFDVPMSSVTVISALAFGLWFSLGPLTGWLITKFGNGKVLVASGLIMSLGLVGSTFATNISIIILCFGVLSGSGAGLGFVSSWSATPCYFVNEKYQQFVSSALTIGASFGSVTIPLMFQLIIDRYPWQFCYSMAACLSMQLVVFGVVFEVMELPGKICHVATDSSVAKLMPKQSEPELESFTYETHFKQNRQLATFDFETAKFDEKPDVVSKKLPVSKDILNTITMIPNKLKIGLNWISCLFWNFGFFVWFVTLPLSLADQEISESDIARLVSAMNILTIAGRLFASGVTLLFRTGNVKTYLMATLSCGIMVTLFTLPTQYFTCLCFGCAYHFFMGIILASRASICITFVGVEHLGIVLGFMLFAAGLGALLGPILAGAVLDLVGNYQLCYAISAILHFVSFFVMLPIPFLR